MLFLRIFLAIGYVFASIHFKGFRKEGENTQLIFDTNDEDLEIEVSRKHDDEHITCEREYVDGHLIAKLPNEFRHENKFYVYAFDGDELKLQFNTKLNENLPNPCSRVKGFSAKNSSSDKSGGSGSGSSGSDSKGSDGSSKSSDSNKKNSSSSSNGVGLLALPVFGIVFTLLTVF